MGKIIEFALVLLDHLIVHHSYVLVSFLVVMVKAFLHFIFVWVLVFFVQIFFYSSAVEVTLVVSFEAKDRNQTPINRTNLCLGTGSFNFEIVLMHFNIIGLMWF